MAGLNASDTETEQRWGEETCIILPTSKVLIIFTFIKFTTWAFKVSKTLVIKDQGGQGVGSRFPNAAVHPTGLWLPLIPFSSIQWSSLLGHQSRGRIWSLPLSTPHLLAPPEIIFLQLLLPYAFHPALHTQPGPWGSGLLWSQSLKDTPPLKVPRRALKILQNWALLLLSLCLFCSGDTKLPARNDWPGPSPAQGIRTLSTPMWLFLPSFHFFLGFILLSEEFQMSTPPCSLVT